MNTTIKEQYFEQIQADKIALIHKNTPLILIANLLASIPIVLFLWNTSNSSVIFAWAAGLYFITFIRWLYYTSNSVVNTSFVNITQQGKYYVLFAFLSGCVWGSLSLLFFSPENLYNAVFILLVLITINSGSMVSLSSYPVSYLAFAIPTLIPSIIIMLYQGTNFYFMLSAGELIFLIITLAFSRNFHNLVEQSLTLKYENIILVENLKKQTEFANQANEDKSSFLAASSHDLRQPLHAINLFLEVLESKIKIKDQQQDLSRVRQGIESLSELFDALLDISRFDSNKIVINLSNFSIDTLLNKVHEQFLLEAQKKQLELNIKSCKKIVKSDPILLERIIRNLLSNAIRYTDGGSVDIHCKIAKNNTLQLSICDTGIGIPKNKINSIFNEFSQLNNPERDRTKGLGLGLAIVKRISALLTHPLIINSKVDKGTQFTLELPLGSLKDEPLISLPKLSINDKLTGLHVLVIDNELNILDAMDSLLKSWQCHFAGARSAETALKLIDNGFKPDFILSDYRLPGSLNGCQLVKKIQNKLGDVPTLIISGDTGEKVNQEVKESSLILLTKPIKFAQLRLAMTRLITSKNG